MHHCSPCGCSTSDDSDDPFLPTITDNSLLATPNTTSVAPCIAAARCCTSSACPEPCQKEVPLFLDSHCHSLLFDYSVPACLCLVPLLASLPVSACLSLLLSPACQLLRESTLLTAAVCCYSAHHHHWATAQQIMTLRRILHLSWAASAYLAWPALATSQLLDAGYCFEKSVNSTSTTVTARLAAHGVKPSKQQQRVRKTDSLRDDRQHEYSHRLYVVSNP